MTYPFIMRSNRLALVLWMGMLPSAYLSASDAGGEHKGSEHFVPYVELNEQPRFPTTEKLWNVLQYPVLRSHYDFPVTAVIAIVVDAKGKVVAAELIQSDEKDFGVEAVQAVETWTIKPGRKNGKLVACATIVTLRSDAVQKATHVPYSRGATLATPRPAAPPKKS